MATPIRGAQNYISDEQIRRSHKDSDAHNERSLDTQLVMLPYGPDSNVTKLLEIC